MSTATCCLITLGCPKNLVDSERMLGLLKLDGYQLVREPEGADFVVVNTCGFIHTARQESLQTIREMVKLKKRGKLGGVIVAGCLAERDKLSLLEQCPGIDQLIGLFSREEIARAADRVVGRLTEQRAVFRPAASKPLPDGNRLRITPRHLAYLKISEGCDRLCTFCSIPSIRGKHVSKPLEEVIAEARQLVRDGVRELNIVAQDTTYYGLDLYGEPRLAELLVQLEQIEGLEWIRLMYLYPMYFSEQLIERPGRWPEDSSLSRFALAAHQRPGVATDESPRGPDPNGAAHRPAAGADRRARLADDDDHRFPGRDRVAVRGAGRLYSAQRFERLGAFVYSREPGTPAQRLEGQLPEKVKRARRQRLLAVQQEIAFAWNASKVGQPLDVLIDGYVPDAENAYLGRSYADAPEIDGSVYVTGENLAPGRIVPCEVVAFRDYDLVAVAVGPPR